MNRRTTWALALSLALGWGASLPAQTAAPERSAPQEGAAPPEGLLPDLEIVATVRMRELRVVEAPQEARVAFPGEPQRWTIWRTEEQNLPEELVSGATYLDALVRLTVASTFVDAVGVDAVEEVRPPLSPPGTER